MDTYNPIVIVLAERLSLTSERLETFRMRSIVLTDVIISQLLNIISIAGKHGTGRTMESICAI